MKPALVGAPMKQAIREVADVIYVALVAVTVVPYVVIVWMLNDGPLSERRRSARARKAGFTRQGHGLDNL